MVWQIACMPGGGVIHFQMAVVVPGQRADAVAGADAELLQHAHQAAGRGASVSRQVLRWMVSSCVRETTSARAVVARGVAQERGDHQRLGLHQTEHDGASRCFFTG